MVKTGTLLLLLAVAASQVDLSLSQTTITDTGLVDFTICPLFLYGAEYTLLSVTINDDASVDICFINNPGETSQDCLLLSHLGHLVFVTVYPITEIVPILPGQTSSCEVYLEFTAGGPFQYTADLFLIKFNQQTVLKLVTYPSFNSAANHVFEATVDNSTVYSQNWTVAETSGTVYSDLLGCRHSGSAFVADSVIMQGEGCSNLICDASAVVKNVSTCGPFEECNVNNTCVPYPIVCTVTGSSVIDVFGRVHTVQDQCAYNLMTPQQNQGFVLLAVFREQRRKDVLLLDHMMINLTGGGVINLGQSGRVLVDDQTVELNATAQLFHGVELSKDQTGVTAKFTPSLSNMTVFFDGNTAQMSGNYEDLGGFCGFTSNQTLTPDPAIEKFPPLSALGCETQHSDDPDSTINCTIATERCNLLNQAPFTACHDHADPEPFITACTNLSCQYPMEDGLNCRFLEAYANSCFLRDNIILEWRSQTGCPVRQAFCPQYCSDHEFCGESLGESHCLCRATFASTYKPTDDLGDPTVCTESSATLTLAECLLAEKGIDYSTLHLNDPNCKGEKNEETHMVTFSFNSSNTCGTEVMHNNSQVMYMNTITTGNNSSGVINRDTDVTIDFSCYYTVPEDVQSVSFKIKDSSVVKEIVSGVWNYNLLMNAYTDSGLMNLVGPETEILLNQPVWVELKTEGLDENMVAIVTDSCWATAQSPPDSTPRYDLVTDGCANSADMTVSVLENGLGTYSAVSFRMFEFPGLPNEVYLHCEVELCPTLGQSCAPTCGGGDSRKRRAFRTKFADGNAALITMGWNN